MTKIDIVEAQFDDEGDIAFAAEFPVDPYGEALFASPDNSEESRRVLHDLAQHWPELWPVMRQRLEQGVAECALDLDLATRPFTASVTPMEEDVFMSDKADIHVRFDFDDFPVWDFFIQSNHLVHFQPVF